MWAGIARSVLCQFVSCFSHVSPGDVCGAGRPQPPDVLSRPLLLPRTSVWTLQASCLFTEKHCVGLERDADLSRGHVVA